MTQIAVCGCKRDIKALSAAFSRGKQRLFDWVGSFNNQLRRIGKNPCTVGIDEDAAVPEAIALASAFTVRVSVLWPWVAALELYQIPPGTVWYCH